MITLYIAEKPSLAKAIFEGLGGDSATQKKNGFYQHQNNIVTWCFGHMLRLNNPEEYNEAYKKWDLNHLPIKSVYPPTLQPIESSKQQLNIIIKLIEKSQVIVNAGDPDASGQNLIDEILLYVNNTKPEKRVLIADLNPKAVKRELANLRDNSEFKTLNDSELARAISDQSFGYNLTRAFTMKGQSQGYDQVLNVGRVQSAVLGLINTRTLANESHKESFYYDVTGDFKFENATVKAKLKPTDADNIDEKKRIIDEKNASAIKTLCESNQAIITGADTGLESKAPPQPYNLSSLQQKCAKAFGMSAQQTLDTVQSLYESKKLVSYPRSDCRFLSDEHHENAAKILTAIAHTGNCMDIVKKCNPSKKHKAFNSAKITAHHAIIPTETNGKNMTLTTQERNVYDLIANSFIALFYPNSTRSKTRINIECKNKHFTANQSVLKTQGWEVLFKGEISEEKNDNTFDVSTLKTTDIAQCDAISIAAKKTAPPKYFVESTLLAAMTRAAKFIENPELRKGLEAKDKDNSAESGSIGTEATRAGILEKLAANPLISLEEMKGYKEKVWRTTKQGQEFVALLPKEITAPDTSAIWTMKQAKILNGEMSVKAFVDSVDNYILERVTHIKNNKLNLTIDVTHCPKCKTGILGRRKGKDGIFWGCNSYPDCKSSYPDKKGKPDLNPKPKARAKTKKPVRASKRAAVKA